MTPHTDQLHIFKLRTQDNFHLLIATETKCPECESQNFKLDDQGHLYCTHCGSVLAAIHPYVAGERIDLPWGLLI